MIEYFVGFPHDHQDQLEALLKAYWSEADERSEALAVDIDLEGYKKLEEVGYLKVIYAMEGDQLVGLIAAIISTCMHTGREKSVVEVVYVGPAHRGAGIADTMIFTLEDVLRQEGVPVNFFTLKKDLPHDNLVEDLEYRHVENIYMKVIG